MSTQRFSLHCLIPPYILDALSKSKDPAVRKAAVDAIEASATARAVRTTLSTMPQMAAIPSPAREKHRLIYDLQARNFSALPGKLVRSEGEARGSQARAVAPGVRPDPMAKFPLVASIL